MKPDEYANGKGIADSQIRCCRSLCRQALEKAAEEHLILCNPAIGCKCPPAKREEMKIPSGETMQRVLIQAKEENYYELFPLEFATGLRLRELAALQWDDLNLTTGELRIDECWQSIRPRWIHDGCFHPQRKKTCPCVHPRPISACTEFWIMRDVNG